MGTMNPTYKMFMLFASFFLMVLGNIYIEMPGGTLTSFICFMAAVPFIYNHLGRGSMMFDFSKIHESSKRIVLGKVKLNTHKWDNLQAKALSFSVILVCFSLGIGVGRLLYQIVH